MKRGIIVFLFFLNFIVAFGQIQGKQISLDDIYTSRKFAVEGVSGIFSMKDGERYTTLSDYRNIILWKYNSGEVIDTLFSVTKNSSTLKYIYDYQFSADESKILISSNVEAIYRHSFKADYYVYDLKTGKLESLSNNGPQGLADFSPDGKRIAFVRDNNLFIRDIESGNEKQITTDGKKNEVINGAPDWVYEEEFGFSKGFTWSPGGKYLAFMRFDESKVKTYTLTYFDNLYPNLYEYKYPKAGEANSVVSVQIYNVESNKVVSADLGKETDQYIPRICWTEENEMLGIVRLNRLQNKVDVLIANASSGKCSILFSESNKYYISEVGDRYINFLSDKKHFIVFSERDGYSHLYLYNISGKFERQLTFGNYDVTDFLGFNAEKKSIYYSSSEPSPIQKAVYSIGLDGKEKQRLTEHAGINLVEFNSTYKYYIHTWSNANTPPVITLNSINGKAIRTLEGNSQLIAATKEFNFAKKDFFEFKNPEGIVLMGYMIKPVNFDSTHRYPLFMFVYGGPESQEVTDEWDASVSWFQMLAQKGYIVACVDNRGTNNRGEAFRKSTYMQLGKLETEDQISVAKYLSNKAFVDSTRIGIFGWSYGGYMSSLCMTKGADIFKLGIAVAPVTNWRYYDNIYTERFMRTPQENPSGYDKNSPINFASQLKGKFLLIHGSADDNVHVQNSMEFAEKLIQSKKQFDMMVYPNKNHGIYGGNTRLQLYTKMTDFILSNL